MDNQWKVIAHIYNDYQEKFGIPRQSGLVQGIISRIVFEKEYRVAEALRGLEDYDYIWLLWQFSKNYDKPWSATVKPPRLGGKKRMGVFATRSPYRPNNIGLSSVKMERIDLVSDEGPVIYVSGADLLDGTPIYDMKPYLAYTDSHPEAREGFAGTVKGQGISVKFPQELLEQLPADKREPIMELLRQDPRPGYDGDITREYKLVYAGYDIWFRKNEEGLEVFSLFRL